MSEELKPWDSIDSGDLDSAEQFLVDNPGHAAFFPCDAHKLANISLHCIREVRATRAELTALKADQGEAVYVVPVTGSLDEIDAPVWPFINAEAQKVGAEHGRIETYKYERANGGVAVLWDANRIHAMAVTIRDDMNRTRCIRMLTAPPATADAVSVPREFVRFLLGETDLNGYSFGDMHQVRVGKFWWRTELRALLARQEVKS